MTLYSVQQFATKENWIAIDTAGSGGSRARKIAVQKRKLRDLCTLRKANGDAILFEGFRGELVEGRLDAGVWVPDRRKVLRNDMKHTNSLTGAGGVLAVLLSWGVATIEEH